MRLTNIQLNVLRDKIYSEIRKKIIPVELLETIKSKIEKTYSYNKLLSNCVEIEHLEKECTEIRDKIQKIYEQNAKLISDKKYFVSPKNTEQVEKFINKKVEQVCDELLPTISEIESEIIIASLENSTDFLETIINKFTNNLG